MPMLTTLYKHMQFSSVKIVTLAEGEISELHVGLKGTMNALFLKDLAKKTHRGLRGRVEQGKAGGGLCYGYDIVKRLGGDGEPVRGERSINAVEAAVVRRVFQDFANGISPRSIAQRLKDDRIPGPGGKLWASTTLRGHVKRGTGFLIVEAPLDKPDIHPNIAEIYRRKVKRLAEALNNPAERDEAADAIRGLIERVTLTPGAKRGEVHVTLHGEFGAILEWVAAREAKESRHDKTPSAGALGVLSASMVAGTGFDRCRTRMVLPSRRASGR